MSQEDIEHRPLGLMIKGLLTQGQVGDETTADIDFNNTDKKIIIGRKSGTSGNATDIVFQTRTGTQFMYISGVNSAVAIGSGTPTSTSAILELGSTTKGFLPPRLTTTQRNTLSGTTPTAGTMIFNTTTGKLEVYTTAGFESVTSSGP